MEENPSYSEGPPSLQPEVEASKTDDKPAQSAELAKLEPPKQPEAEAPIEEQKPKEEIKDDKSEEG